MNICSPETVSRLFHDIGLFVFFFFSKSYTRYRSISFSIQWSKSVMGPLHFHVTLKITLSVSSFHKMSKQKLLWFSLKLHGLSRPVWGELTSSQSWIFKTMNMVCPSIFLWTWKFSPNNRLEFSAYRCCISFYLFPDNSHLDISVNCNNFFFHFKVFILSV